jgi:hypothetical protein
VPGGGDSRRGNDGKNNTSHATNMTSPFRLEFEPLSAHASEAAFMFGENLAGGAVASATGGGSPPVRSTGLCQEHPGETQVSPRPLSWRFIRSIKAAYRRREGCEMIGWRRLARKEKNRLRIFKSEGGAASDAAFDVRPGSSPQDVARIDNY